MMRPSGYAKRLLGIGLALGLPVAAVALYGLVAPALSDPEAPFASGPGPADTGSGLRTATFSMYCYWTGEAVLGTVPGVVRTRIGLAGMAEVVEVTYNPAVTDLGSLAAALKARKSFYACLVPDASAAREARAVLSPGEVRVERREPKFTAGKHTLRTTHPELVALGLTEVQALVLNSWSRFGGPMPDVLTPEQKARLSR